MFFDFSLLLSLALGFRLGGHAPSSGERLRDQQRNSTCKLTSHHTRFTSAHLTLCFSPPQTNHLLGFVCFGFFEHLLNILVLF